MSGIKTPRRRVIISSDEDTDSEQEKSKHSDLMSEDGDVVNESVISEADDDSDNSRVSEAEEEDDSAVIESKEEGGDLVVAESDDEDEEEEPVASTPITKTGRGSSFVASTPLSNTQREEDALNETFDRMSVGEPTTRSLSSSSVENYDRDRSFHAKEAEESPISKRLNAQSDVKSKQALRERLLRKQAMTARGSNASRESSDRSSSLLNSTLSPIGLKHIPKQINVSDTPSAGSVSEMDTRSPLQDKSLHTSATGESTSSREGAEMDESRSVSGSGSSNASMESSRGESSSPGTDKENDKRRSARKKLNMDNVDPAEEKVRKFMTPRRTAKIEDSEEEKDVQTAPYPQIESDDEEDMKKEESIVEIIDSDEEEQKDVHDIVDSDVEEDVLPPQLQKEEEDDAIVISSSTPSPTHSSPTRPSAIASSTALHPTTMKTHTEDDVKEMENQLGKMMNLLHKPGMNLPDGGAQLRRKIEELTTKIENARLAQPARRVAPPEPKGRLQVIDPPSNVDDYNKIVVDDGLAKKRLVGGVMTDDRVANVKRITTETLDKMHKEVTSQPEGEETETPRGLRVELMGHQKTGLTWMLWRERQHAPGGILADDMGLGKTMSMISLVMHAKNERAEKEDEEDEKWIKREDKYKAKCKEAGLAPSHATLVIAPASVIFQWEAEINKRVKGSRLSVLVFHGPKNKREERAKKLAKYDVVITTYNIITAELTEKVNITNDSDDEDDSDDDDAKFGKKAAVAADGKSKSRVSKSQISVLTKVHWDRIILDEAHQIKNRNALISKAVCRLPGRNRWCLTGTPVHNNLFDLFSLVRFLKVHPFDELTLWKENIMDARHGSQRLNTLVKSLLLRRMKNQVDTKTNKPLVALAPKKYEILELSLEGLEKSIYDLMFRAVKEKVATFVQSQKDQKDIELFGRVRRKKNEKDAEDEDIVNPFLSVTRDADAVGGGGNFQAMKCILVLLLRLRQAVVHLSLTKEAMDLSAFEGLPMDTNAEILDAELSQLSLDEAPAAEEAEKSLSTTEDVERAFTHKFLSTKIRVFLDKMDHAVKSGDKCVVVSQWTSVLKIVEYHIRKRRIEFTEITGEIATKDRQERVDSFNRVGGGAQVMLLSLTAGGVGLNLIGGNHLFLLDLHWNPALEAQACDRIYRMGQTKDVFIHKLMSKHTIEESILALQDKKSALAKSVLEGAADTKLNKLTVADLKFLFDLDGEQKRKELAEASKKAIEQYPTGAAATAAARMPPPTSSYTAASQAYNNAVYGGASRPLDLARPPVKKDEGVEVITL